MKSLRFIVKTSNWQMATGNWLFSEIPKRSEGSLSKPTKPYAVAFSSTVLLVARLKFVVLIGIPPLRQAQGRDFGKKPLLIAIC